MKHKARLSLPTGVPVAGLASGFAPSRLTYQTTSHVTALERSPAAYHANAHPHRAFRWAFTCLALAAITGCASVNFDENLRRLNDTSADFTQGQLALAQTPEQREAMDRTAGEILKKPVTQSDAVRLALVNSPALQALLAQSRAEMALAAQSGRIKNPVLSLERIRSADELELTRMLSLGLLDLLTLPQRAQMAEQRVAQQQLRMAREVVDQVTQVRQAWVNAVAAQQSRVYARQVHDTAKASAELARRLQSAGNFSTLQRARQQAFYADATTQWASAQQVQLATREALTRLLGLSDVQAKQLTLPDRLPDLPKQPRTPQEVAQSASKGRLDIQLARSAWDAQVKAQGLSRITSLTDLELGLKSTRVQGNEGAAPANSRGTEVSVVVPIFDWGDYQREAMNAQTLAAAYQLEATLRAANSHLRESYGAYRTAFDIARHYRDEVVPLRKTISDENVLRYNGMLIGVFELLADARDQMSTVMAAISAEQQFWLADAALAASVMGQPTPMPLKVSTTAGGNDAAH